MPITVTPYIPKEITVHLGTPDAPAENVTVPFVDYIKNVASSEIYPTWQISALRANILAQVSFALNRVYTEFYISQGYDFNITNTTAYDQRFIKGRNIFENVSLLVDELFNDYLRRQGFIEPLSAKFCNGTTSQCDGLSQWGSEYMARDGRNSVEILRSYYGSNVEIVVDAPIQDIRYSYPGIAMRLGQRSPSIQVAQVMLNRVGTAYPALPKIPSPNGYFGPQTDTAVRKFQEIFHLTQDGIIGRGTWYNLVRLYTSILQLSELVSLGQQIGQFSFDYDPDLNDRQRVSFLQYLLSVLAQFYLNIPAPAIDGIFGNQTRQSVQALQLDAGLPQTGTVTEATWDTIVERYLSIDRTVLSAAGVLPFTGAPGGSLSPEAIQDALNRHPDQFPGTSIRYGQTD